MLVLIIIGWMLEQLSAPVWCWVLFWLACSEKLITFGYRIAAAVKEQ